MEWRFHSGMKLEMKSTFIMVEIMIVYKKGNFIHLLKCISAKIDEKNKMIDTRTSFNVEWDFDSPQSFNQLNLSCKHGLNLKCRSGLKLSPDLCKPLLNIYYWLWIILYSFKNIKKNQ